MQTPYYVIKTEQFNANCQAIEDAFHAVWGEKLIIGYSVKTNANPELIKMAKGRGWRAEVVSQHEMELAESLGFGSSEMLCNGPVKKEMLFRAISQEQILNLDSLYEVQLVCDYAQDHPEDIQKMQIGIRVNFDAEKCCPGQTQKNGEVGRFGISLENGDVRKAIEMLRNAGIPIKGLHMHISSLTRSVEIYQAICRTAVETVETYDLKPEFIDIGGGFFGGRVITTKPSMEQYASAVAEILKSNPITAAATLVIEPGTSVTATAIDYVTTVASVKMIRDTRIVTLDGTVLHINPFMAPRTPEYTVLSENPVYQAPQVLCGCTCVEADRFASLENEKELAVGDRVIWHNVGSYSQAFNSNFIIRPPETTVK